MIVRICLMLAVFSMMPIWAQTDSGTQNSSDESQMVAPPPVSGQAFSATPVSEERSNYLGIGLTGSAAYVTNVMPDEFATPVGDESYSIGPSLSFDRTSARLRETLICDPGFTFYQHTSVLNQWTQNASGRLDYSPSQHSTLSLSDAFLKASNTLSAPYSFSAGSVSGSPVTQDTVVIAPYANLISNTGSGEYTYQFSRTGMIGVGGGTSETDYPNPNQSSGLFNSTGYNGGGFSNARVSRRQYAGASYGFTEITESTPYGNLKTQTSLFSGFYSLFIRQRMTLSLSGGPDYYAATVPGTPNRNGWEPGVVGSFHLQQSKAAFSLGYQHLISAGGGLAGAFRMDVANADVNVQMNRTWGVGASGGYTNNKSILPPSQFSEPGGHSFSTSVALRHSIREHVQTELGYSYLRQEYAGISIIAATPTVQRVYGTISYQLRRPLGR